MSLIVIIGKNLCNITTAFRYINAFADWMSVAMIAVSRCLTLTKPELGQKLFSGRYGKIIIGMIWVYASILIVPMYVPAFELGSFGYNCRVGKCDFIPGSNGQKNLYQIYAYGIGFSIPCIMTTVSYIIISWYIGSTNKYLKEVGHSNIKKIITKRYGDSGVRRRLRS